MRKERNTRGTVVSGIWHGPDRLAQILDNPTTPAERLIHIFASRILTAELRAEGSAPAQATQNPSSPPPQNRI